MVPFPYLSRMKHVIWILALLPLGLWGRTCRLGFGPATPEIGRDAAFLIEACGCAPGTLAELDRSTPAWLLSEAGDSVPMRLVVLEDGMIQQALLRPARPLRIGERYRLAVPGLLERGDVDAPEEARWQVTTDLDESMVGFKEQPSCPYSAKLDFGDGKTHHMVKVSFQPLESARYWVRVRIEDEWTGDGQSWLVAFSPGQDAIAVGWPMRDCGPGMDLVEGVEYKLSLTLYGADGAEGRSSDPVRITMGN